MNVHQRTPSAAARWRWTCAALAAAASMGASVDAPAESAVVSVTPIGVGAARSGQPGAPASVRLNFQVVIPPRMEIDSTQGMRATSNLKGKVQTTVDDRGAVPMHTVSIP